MCYLSVQYLWYNLFSFRQLKCIFKPYLAIWKYTVLHKSTYFLWYYYRDLHYQLKFNFFKKSVLVMMFLVLLVSFLDFLIFLFLLIFFRLTLITFLLKVVCSWLSVNAEAFTEESRLGLSSKMESDFSLPGEMGDTTSLVDGTSSEGWVSILLGKAIFLVIETVLST